MTDCIHSIIDGFPDYLHKLALAERPTIPSPKRQRVETSVLGRLGGLVQDYSFEDMSFTLHYNYLQVMMVKFVLILTPCLLRQ